MNAIGWLTRRRAATGESGSVFGRSSAWLGPLFDAWGRKTTSGERVTEETARSLSTYWACASGISEDIAGVPVSVVRRLKPRGREPLADHSVTRLLHEDFNPETTALVGRQTMQGWRDTWGRAYAEIERDGRGDPLALWPIHPSRSRLVRDKDGRYGAKGEIGLVVKAEDVGIKDAWIPYADVFHLRGWGSTLDGHSVLRDSAESIGAAIAAQRFGAAVFGNDLTLGLVISPKTPLEANAGEAFKKSLSDAYKGAANAHGALVPNHPVDVARTAIPPEEAQYLETRQFQVEDVCRWFRRSPQMVGFTSRAQGWSTIDALQIADVVYCIVPRVKCWEAEAEKKLLRRERGLVVRHYVQGLMRGDPKTRGEFYRTLLASGVMTPNEVRELEDMNPSDEENADRLTVQGATILLGSLSDEPPEPTPPPAPPMQPSPTEPDEEEETGEPEHDVSEDDGYEASARPFYRDAARRVVRKECKALDAALKKFGANADHFREWADKFYAEQRDYATECFQTCCDVAAERSHLDGTATTAFRVWTRALWPDPLARTGEALRTKEEDLAAALAESAFTALNRRA